MLDALIIRDSRMADLPAIAEIYAHAVRYGTGTFEIDPPDLAEMTKRYEIVKDKDLPYLVAEYEGRIAGYCYAGVYRPRPAYRFTVENSIYIAEDFRRRNIGRRLLDELIRRCEKKSYRLMIAVIGDSGNASSIKLHEAAGFKHSGVFAAVGWKFNR